jgi:hypothetical protein
VIEVHSQRHAYQSIITMNEKPYLVRLIVETGDPPTVITVYRTSRIDKYWSRTR